MSREKEEVAKRLLKLANELIAQDEEDEEEDPNFIAKVRNLKKLMNKLGSKKRRKLSQYNIGIIKGVNTVEDLVDALMKVVSA